MTRLKNALRPANRGPFLAGLLICLLLLLGAASAQRYITTTQASLEVSRLFLNLERTIGYDGFIHNFKNAVLRPNEPIYMERARADLARATATIERIDLLAQDLDLPDQLAPLSETLLEYGRKLDTIETLDPEQLSSREMDEFVRVSDSRASAAVGNFETTIGNFLEARKLKASLSFGIAICSVIVLLATLLFFQISGRRRAEAHSAEVERQDRLLHRAEDLAKLGRWESDIEEGLTWSGSALRMLGMEGEKMNVSREYAWDIIHPEDRSTLRLAMRKAIEGDGHFSCVHRMTRLDGKVILVNNIGEAIRTKQGNIAGFSGTIQDVSDIFELEGRLRQAQKMEAVGQLAGGMAHDFNNLLSVILGNLEMLSDTASGEDQKRYLTTALDATKKGARLTQSILGFARKSSLLPAQTDLNKYLGESKEIIERVLPATISLDTAYSAGLWMVEVDRDLLLNAMLNLVVNARDAMPDGGHITIETANIRIDDEYIDAHGEEIEPGRYAMIAVTDTGTGIEPDLLERIFEPFFTTKPPGKGSGVGLSMVQGFMRQSKGTILVYSELGVGTTVKLYFKTSIDSYAPTLLPDEKVAQVGNGKGTRVLVVEDESAVLNTLEQALIKAGFVVLTAQSGDEALSLWGDTRDYDILLTDIVMPGKLQGTQLAEKLREQRPDLPVVFMSGYAAEATVHGNGVRPDDGRVMKPVSRAELVKTLNAVLLQQAQKNQNR